MEDRKIEKKIKRRGEEKKTQQNHPKNKKTKQLQLIGGKKD